MKTDLVEIFQSIRAEMQPYAVQGLNAKLNAENTYELWTDKAIEIGKKKEEIFYASVSIGKNAVLLKLMQVDKEDLKNVFRPELLKLLNNKSTFELNKLDDLLLEQISLALATTFATFKQNEWV